MSSKAELSTCLGEERILNTETAAVVSAELHQLRNAFNGIDDALRTDDVCEQCGGPSRTGPDIQNFVTRHCIQPGEHQLHGGRLTDRLAKSDGQGGVNVRLFTEFRGDEIGAPYRPECFLDPVHAADSRIPPASRVGDASDRYGLVPECPRGPVRFTVLALRGRDQTESQNTDVSRLRLRRCRFRRASGSASRYPSSICFIERKTSDVAVSWGLYFPSQPDIRTDQPDIWK